MKKMIMTLMLAIAGSVWTMSEAACYPQEPDNLALQYITVSGTIQDLGTPCEEGEVCPPCLTPAIVTSDKTYYLTTSNQAVQNFLEHMETSPVPSIYSLPLQAKASGTPFTRGNYNFLIVSDINSLYVQYFSDRLDLPSLCDEWNILEIAYPDGYEKFHTVKQRLTTDTIIGANQYVKLEQSGKYLGALREGTDKDIYYIPANSTREYLLYAFNAKVGDVFENAWMGGIESWAPDGYIVSVENIYGNSPRIYELKVQFGHEINDTPEGDYAEWTRTWIEGIGFTEGPSGSTCPFPCEGDYNEQLLCAYKNGEQVYVSESGEKYGCEYNVEQPRLPSLCDEWNVLHEPFECIGPNCFLQTIIYRLSADTLIQDKHYVKLMSEEGSSTTYKGALREGTNRDIYYVPENSTNEYLIYAFNAQVGDELENVWLGGEEERDYCINAHNATVIEISNSNPRIFTLEIIPTTSYEDKEIYPYRMNWIEGIGMSDGPVGSYDRNQLCTAAADMGVYSLLCAYTEGEQVYTSEMGQKYGCYYDGGTQQDRLPSLCDEWNVLMDSGFELGPVYGEIWTNGFKVHGDTIINSTHYSRLLFADGYHQQSENWEWVYYGAIRETTNAEIYFIPAGKNKEYLLYAFNAQIGDRMNNLYIMDDYKEWNVWAIVKEISGNEIILDFYEQLDDREDIVWHNYTWVKGIGAKRSMFQPIPINSGGGVVNFLLCAYNDEKHIYTSEFGEEYGCYYDGEKPQATTWHCVSVYRDMFDYDNVYFSPATYQLQGDTLFGDTRYKTLRSENGTYWGAVRKTDDGQQVYYHPRGAERYLATTGKEYLLYDYSVKEGDTVVAYSGFMDIYYEEDDPYVHFTDSMVVVSVQVIDGRKHVLVQRLHETGQVEWIEGIGTRSVLFSCDRNVLPGNNWGLYTLCAADSEGNVLYSFDTDYLGVHNNCPDFTLITNTPPSDTIPLFIKDGPGSSTVQPVDPNEIVAMLQVDVLSIFEYIGKEIGYKLSQTSSGNTPIIKRLVKSDTFHESVAVTLTENGTYLLELTHPDWDYTIVGTFEYMGGENAVINTEATVPSARKIMRDGQLLIRKGDKIYTLTGVQIQ